MTTPTIARSTSATLAPPASPTAARAADVSSRPTEGIALRFLQRFVLIALGLYHVPLFLNNYPSLGGGGFNDGLAVRWGHVFTPPGVWIARHLFHMTGPMPTAYNGDNGDVGEEFGRLLLAVVIGLAVAAVWTLGDRARPGAKWVRETTRVLLRYSIALGLASYAIAKLLPQQFPPLSPIALERRVGELSPMALLWQFMEYSRPYAFFGGVMEAVVVLLLCFRRTATLGAVLCLAVMSNVAAMNWFYDVPVKLYATMTVVSAAVIVLYDLPRLVPVFLTGRTVPRSEDSFIHERISTRTRWILKALALGTVALSSIAAMTVSLGTAAKQESGANGAWDLASFSRNGESLPYSGDRTRWRRLLIDQYSVSIRLETDSIVSCGRTGDGSVLTLTCAGGRKGELHWTRNGAALTLDGTFDGATVAATGRRLSRGDYRLLRSKTHVIADR
jgi:hypothetical protein